MGHQAGTHSESEAGDGSAQIRASSLGRVHAWRKPREAAESGLQQRHGTVVPSQRVSPRRYTPPPPRCTMLRASIRAFAKRSGSKRASVRLYQKDHRATAAPSDNHDSTLETHLLGDPRPRRLSLRRDRWSARFKGGARCVLGGPRPRGRIVSGSVPDACDHRARPHLPMCGRLSVLHAMRRLV
jgi:hypothetical protein